MEKNFFFLDYILPNACRDIADDNDDDDDQLTRQLCLKEDKKKVYGNKREETRRLKSHRVAQ